MTGAQEIVLSAASRLRTAAETRVPCAPVRDLLGISDIGLGYRVQQHLTDQRVAAGVQIVGRKIGLTSVAVQKQLGVDQPDFGVLFEDMVCSDGTVASARLMQPKAEAEIAFILAEDIDDDQIDVHRARDAISYAVAALEIVDSRVRDWDICITDTVADNGSSGLFVLGAKQVKLDEFEPAEVQMSLTKDGEVASTGSGEACLGDPLAALVWLARAARQYGSPLRAGDVVLSGALGPMVSVTAGSRISADITSLGEVSVAFS